MFDDKVRELLALATAEGLTLPYPPETIARLEATGAIVDLVTGAILVGEADTVYRFELTPEGKAVADLLERETGRKP